jgi:N-acetylglucosaminyl-diphospho-decaprenol L-rhamnosyltransferase
LIKVSVVILCWNDLKVISDCIASIYAKTHSIDFEVIVSDNGSTDGSVEFIRMHFPQVRVIENGTNLRFAKGNNVAIEASLGEYVLILNPDTLMHDGTLDKIVAYADRHPETGAFGCRILNPDGSYQGGIRPLPSVRSEWCLALGLRPLARLSDWFNPGEYEGWKGDTERTVGWLAGCFILIRGELVKRLGGFDAQFFYYYEDTDLCRRVWEAGYPIRFTPSCSITHLGGQSTINRFAPLSFALDAAVTRYLYYYKCYGMKGIRSCRRALLVSAFIRRLGYGLIQIVRPTEAGKKKRELLRALFDWNYRIDLVRLVEKGEEPELDVKPIDRVLER